MLITLLMIFLLIIGSIAFTIINSIKEFQTKYDFVIGKIETTPTGSMRIFNLQGENIKFWNYIIMSSRDIKVGDSVAKESHSKPIYIYRKDNTGEYQQHDLISPLDSYFYKWICK